VVRRLSELILLQTVAVELTRRVSDSSDSHSGVYRMMRAATDSVIGPVLRVMVDKPEAPWTVPQMARMAKVSKSAFSDRFRRLVGLPPLQYLTEIRMGKSRRLLRDSDVEIGEIAYLVGYESPSSFSNVFKRWHGMSPIEYRRSIIGHQGYRVKKQESRQ
jgi:AraC-like DNA-binding protein